MSAKRRSLFISHSWSYGDTYVRLCELLDQTPRFTYSNYSVPRDNPVHDAPTKTELRSAIKSKIAPCQIVLIMAGKYATYSEWIHKEIEIAKRDFTKPVLAIAPWGAHQTSKLVKDNADLVVRWNTTSIVGGIRELVP